jgi:hypothetical protein
MLHEPIESLGLRISAGLQLRYESPPVSDDLAPTSPACSENLKTCGRYRFDLSPAEEPAEAA